MIDWSQVEVGDVCELRDGSRVGIFTFDFCDYAEMEFPVDVNYVSHQRDGRCGFGDEKYGGDIVAIHKPGTVGAMSHEERSRLWDKCEEYGLRISEDHGVCVAYVLSTGVGGYGTTRLEAVMKCVAAIEQQKENANG